MFNFINRLLVVIKGWFIRTGDDLVSRGPDAIKSTYAAAISEAMQQYKEMQSGLGLIMQQRNRLQVTLDKLEEQHLLYSTQLEGALKAAQAEPNVARHKEEGQRFVSKLHEIEDKKENQLKELERIAGMLEDYKSKLSSMRTQVEELKAEKAEMLADYVSARNTLRLEEKLSGLPTENTIDDAVVAVREKIEGLKAQVQVIAEIREESEGKGSDYEKLGEESRATTEFEQLLAARTPLRIEESSEQLTMASERVMARELG